MRPWMDIRLYFCFLFIIIFFLFWGCFLFVYGPPTSFRTRWLWLAILILLVCRVSVVYSWMRSRICVLLCFIYSFAESCFLVNSPHLSGWLFLLNSICCFYYWLMPPFVFTFTLRKRG